MISRARRRFVALPGLCDYPWGHSEADAGHRDRVCSMTQARESSHRFHPWCWQAAQVHVEDSRAGRPFTIVPTCTRVVNLSRVSDGHSSGLWVGSADAHQEFSDCETGLATRKTRVTFSLG